MTQERPELWFGPSAPAETEWANATSLDASDALARLIEAHGLPPTHVEGPQEAVWGQFHAMLVEVLAMWTETVNGLGKHMNVYNITAPKVAVAKVKGDLRFAADLIARSGELVVTAPKVQPEVTPLSLRAKLIMGAAAAVDENHVMFRCAWCNGWGRQRRSQPPGRANFCTGRCRTLHHRWTSDAPSAVATRPPNWDAELQIGLDMLREAGERDDEPAPKPKARRRSKKERT